MKPRFNITSAPLSTADLEEQRREYGNGYVAAKKRAHIICWILALVATVGLVPFYFLAANGATSENEMLAAIGAALIILVVLLHGATDEWVAMSASAYAGLVAGAILGVLMDGSNGLTVMLGGVAGGLVAVAVFEKWVGTYLIEVADSVVLLRDLDSAAKPGEDGPTNPDECIDFVKMCKEDDVVREFQHRLVTMGRKPVMGEYHAAKAWIADKDARCEEEKKMAEAKRACDLMVKAI